MLLLASHVDRSASISARCQDLVHCGASWPAAIALAAVLLLPAAALTLLNLVAWRRWRWRRWCAAALAVALSSSAFELRLLCC